MRLVLQRVATASVDVDGKRIAEIGRGVLLLVGIGAEDSPANFSKLAKKIADLRIFEDDAGKMNLSLRDVGGAVLAVSQFTLYADISKGRRPSFVHAASPEVAEPLFDAFASALGAESIDVQTGKFGAKMAVRLENDGPVTLTMEVAG